MNLAHYIQRERERGGRTKCFIYFVFSTNTFTLNNVVFYSAIVLTKCN